VVAGQWAYPPRLAAYCIESVKAGGLHVEIRSSDLVEPLQRLLGRDVPVSIDSAGVATYPAQLGLKQTRYVTGRAIWFRGRLAGLIRRCQGRELPDRLVILGLLLIGNLRLVGCKSGVFGRLRLGRGFCSFRFGDFGVFERFFLLSSEARFLRGFGLRRSLGLLGSPGSLEGETFLLVSGCLGFFSCSNTGGFCAEPVALCFRQIGIKARWVITDEGIPDRLGSDPFGKFVVAPYRGVRIGEACR